MKRLLIGSLLVLLTACSKVNMESYDQVKAGMSYAEVKTVLGEADKCEEKLANTQCIWGNKDKHIKVNFVADSAVYFDHKGLMPEQ
ncbi:DUF3862 domain-containing protein [Lacimicrobium alkaliphilum]|uniref:DUF3862 domain-containing protein n=1 Tax=Lacimicrobium alkaliphilum TaxID=1526571 RepID=A0ABQ1R0Q3_9ALTE|nr:DUF3862 domain-containing protein [Lacimicrobium alkaliphilum]GGD52303.1 hypothetical protein GCM10011357_05220 [Lacimicrobium alkaliphilum]